MNLKERIELYNSSFPEYRPLYLANEKRVEGLWIMGQNYTVKSGYYGGYPHEYLDRVMAMFPDRKRILHLFSGCVEKTDGRFTTFDVNPDRKPDVCGNAEMLAWHFPDASRNYYGSGFDLILADPPYSQEDADHYGTPMMSRKKVLGECHKVLKPSGIVVWLDQVFPMFSKLQWNLIGCIGMVKSTNHRVRGVFMLEKKGV